ncbi:hypothetical protein NFI96_002285 [Prochilodus magdalenae]|nr:hypothetical protein NFI96_002285 [Prochilodus magdalenae]
MPNLIICAGEDAKQHAAVRAADSTNQGNSPLPELRLVLLGRKGTGKSSAGNTILGLTGGFETGKPTEECVKRRSDTAGHRVTVVDTPGWEWYYSSNGTPGWVQKETMRSVSLCPPGPHALLLVVRSCASVTEDYYRQTEEHLELLGKTVWGHTMVLFTRGDELGSIPIEQRIQNGGKAFRKLLERCGNRFHVLENKRRGDDGTQVMELMKKLEEMVKEKGGGHYDSDPLLLVLDVEWKRRARERRKKQRLMEAQSQRGAMKAVLTVDAPQTEDLDERSLFSRGSRRLPELRLILLGERETGKSSAGNAILRGVTYFQTGQATEECSRQQAEVSGRLVTVVDAPGWEGCPDGITPERVKREIGVSVTLCPPGPHALLLTLRVDALVRAAAVREHLELLGEGAWRHTILLFTRGDQLREGVTIEQHIQGGGKDLHWLMEKCGSRYHVISSTCWEGHSSTSQVTGLLEKIEKMVAGNRCEAFSPLVQEIQDLGKQKNERFNQKLKEVNEKLQRQDTELKRMREREVKSIRWFFDRRKDKGKSPEKTSKGKEEAVDRGDDDRKSIMGELEERMAWLTEDKEREIQELSLENSRVIAALSQGYREKDALVMKLEEKEKQERQEREEELTKRHECVEKEVNMLRRELQEREKEKEELTKEEAEKSLVEKQQEMEENKLQAENKIKEQEERWREQSEKREREMNKLREMLELMSREMEELQVAFQEQVKTSEAQRHMHENTKRQREQEMAKQAETQAKLQEKDAEISGLTKRHKEKEQEIDVLKQTLEAKHKTMEILKNDSQAKIAEFTSRINRLEDEYKETEDFLKRENKQNKDKESHLEDLKERLEEGQIHLQAQRAENQRREKEIKDMLNQYEAMGKIKDAQSQELIQEKEKEITEMDSKGAEREQALHSRELELSEREHTQEDEISCREQVLRDEKHVLDKREHEAEQKLEQEMKKKHEEHKAVEKMLESKQRAQKDLEEKKALENHRENELYRGMQELENTKQNHEKWQRKQELGLITQELMEKELMNVKQELEKRQQELADREKHLEMKEHHINKKYEEYEAAERMLEGKKKAQIVSFEKQEKNRAEDLENHTEKLEIKESELSKREQQLMNSEQI